MDELFTISLLLDFYGQMITKRQYEILDLHYNNDYSLGEIAQELKISRQGVHDNIKRGKASLYEMEQKLGLAARFQCQKAKASEILKILQGIDINSLPPSDAENIEKAVQMVKSIMED
jgi:hypothetical protein